MARIVCGMGWFHDFNLKRKVVSVLTDRLDRTGLTAEEIAEEIREPVDEVGILLAVMESNGFALSEKIGAGIVCFRLNRDQPAVAKVMGTLMPEQVWEDVRGYRMNFRITEDQRWEAQVSDLPGMPFLGRTKEEASRNALQMARKLAPKEDA